MPRSAFATTTSALASLFLGGAAAGGRINHGFRSSRDWLPRDFVVSVPTGEELVQTSALPANWDWRNVGGKSYAASDVNQHIPTYCGSCWIHGTVAALNDRIKIARGAAFPDVMISRQAVLNCVPGENASLPPPGCDGGDAFQIHKYLHHHKVPDESCMPYHSSNSECTPYNICRNCAPPSIVLPGVPDGCFAVPGWQGYGVGDFGQVKGEESMKKEIFARGPIACNMACDVDFVRDYSDNALQHEGVFVVDTKFNDSQSDHVVSVTGWGETPGGIKYWIVRNSWGTYWGDLGWFKIRRGVNQNMIESECDWAVPTFGELDEALAGKMLGSYANGSHFVHSSARHSLGASALAAAEPSSPVAPAGLDGSSLLVGAVLGAAIVTAAAAGMHALTGLFRRPTPRQQGLLG